MVYLGEITILQKKKMLHKFIWVQFEWRMCKGTIRAFKHICLYGIGERGKPL